MKSVILDTNFILSCVKKKIDFFREIPERGIQILIPTQVIEEIKRIENSTKKLYFRESAKLAVVILEENRNGFEEIDLKENYVDKGLIKYAKEHPKAIIATLDKELQDKVKNNKMIIRGEKRLEVV